MVTHSLKFEQISNKVFSSLIKTFPVACASDEFYFFPHIADSSITTDPWDDFSSGSIKGIINELSDFLNDLNRLSIPNQDIDSMADKNMLVLFLKNLHDQLGELALWKKQPSLYLTLMNAGLAQAMNQGDNKLVRKRLKGIPEFLDQAIQNIQEVPFYWQDISLELADDCKHFLDLIPGDKKDAGSAIRSVEALENKVRKLPGDTELNIASGLLDRLYSNHLATGLSISEISKVLADEISEMLQIMLTEARQILSNPPSTSGNPEVLIKSVYDKIGLKSNLQSDPVRLFQNELNQIKTHLINEGIIEGDSDILIPVEVEEMPGHFRAIRSASSYSIYPKYPPVNGNFYVLTASGYGIPAENLDEYKMLTAHETYPGHHLLDSSRLSLKNIVRRSLEFPLFYEGWASFAEVLLSYTGYFTDPADRFILAKRRYWRAVRGQVDIGLQTKKLDLEAASIILQKAGIPNQRATASAKIYTLNPGYQTCYTLGIRRFIDLYDHYGKSDLKGFVGTILSNGEVLFSDLQKLMKRPKV